MIRMKYIIVFFLIFLSGLNIWGQGVNCEYLYKDDSLCYKACKLLYGSYRGDKSDLQGTKENQALLDSAILLCPHFADAYYVKAIPYLKRGEFMTWKKIIDQAVQNDSILYLGYRGGSRFMFLRDYKGAIEDIECLKNKVTWDIGTIYNGEYHLEVIRSLSYKGLGDTIKAIRILEKHLSNNNEIGLYDYFHLGVMFYEIKEYVKAESAFQKQLTRNANLADLYFYLSKIERKKDNIALCRFYLEKAYDLYINKLSLRGFDSFMDYPDKIYLAQIQLELDTVELIK